MEQRKFSVGDRVVYFGTTPESRLRYNGSTGTILRINNWGTLENERPYASVRWDKDSPFRRFHTNSTAFHFLDNLQIPMLKYDPAQQGDTEDDI